MTPSSGFSAPRASAGIKSVAKSIARICKTVSGSGTSNITNKINGIICGTLLAKIYVTKRLMLS